MGEALWELLTEHTDLTVLEFAFIVVGTFVVGFFTCAMSLAMLPREGR